MAEIIRRALDAYLAWDDPTYAPVRHPPNKERPFIPALKERGFLGRDCKQTPNLSRLQHYKQHDTPADQHQQNTEQNHQDEHIATRSC